MILISFLNDISDLLLSINFYEIGIDLHDNLKYYDWLTWNYQWLIEFQAQKSKIIANKKMCTSYSY